MRFPCKLFQLGYSGIEVMFKNRTLHSLERSGKCTFDNVHASWKCMPRVGKLWSAGCLVGHELPLSYQRDTEFLVVPILTTNERAFS